MQPTTPAVTTQNLTRRFGRVTALQNVNFHVPAGTILGLLGPNGSGKTTLLSILAGFIAPDSGAFQLLGQPDHRQALARTGSLISRPLLWPHLSCRDNLRCLQGILGLPPGAREVDDSLAQVGLDGSASRRKFGQCSTGMKQRLGLAAALLGDPDLLLLDEPTNGLDPEGMVEIRDLIRQLGQAPGRTIIMSSHLLHEVELTCAHYAIIFRGHLVDQGPLTPPVAPAATFQLNTTDNSAALDFLAAQGWPVAVESDPNAVPTSLSVSTQPGEEWKIARDLARVGIYPSLLQPAELTAATGSLEEKYLAAVGHTESTAGELAGEPAEEPAEAAQ